MCNDLGDLGSQKRLLPVRLDCVLLGFLMFSPAAFGSFACILFELTARTRALSDGVIVIVVVTVVAVLISVNILIAINAPEHLFLLSL